MSVKGTELRRPSFNFRFKDLKDDFWDYVDAHNAKPSDVIREFLHSGLYGASSLSLTEKNELVNELVQLKRQLSGVGANLNQLAHYFNIHDTVSEPKLAQCHRELQVTQKQINKTLAELLEKL
jgi:hypothetical protein